MSWYPIDEDLTTDELFYLSMIEQVFRVKHADKQWKHCELEPHQIEFHRNEGTWCSNNMIGELRRYSDSCRHGCLCGSTKFEYIEDASKAFLSE